MPPRPALSGLWKSRRLARPVSFPRTPPTTPPRLSDGDVWPCFAASSGRTASSSRAACRRSSDPEWRSVRALRSGRRLPWLLLRRREQHVVEDQAVTGRVLVQRQVRRRRPDHVLRILGIVPAIVGPRALAVVSMDVLHPWRVLLE